MTCYSYEGVDAIKAALNKGLTHTTEHVPVSSTLTTTTNTNIDIFLFFQLRITLIAPPLFVMTTITNDRKAGVDVMNAAMGNES